jgi:hypothetical protein
MPYTLTRATSASLKLYNREPCSTIDPYKNGENAYIYSKTTQQQKQDAALKNCVCMASDSLPMQTQDDRAPMTDAIRFRIVLLQVSRRELVLCRTFLLWRS